METDPNRKNTVLIPEELAESFEPIIGQAVTLRPLRPEDADIETAFLTALSPETRASRLLGGVIKITREYITQLTSVDYRRDMAIAATVMLEERETLIGVARYVRDTEGKACEFAIVIADAWQGRGIGRRLLEKIVAVARNRGIGRIYGDVLATNAGMLALARQLGFNLSRVRDDPTLTRIALELAT